MIHKLGTPCLIPHKPEYMFVGLPTTQYDAPGYMLFPMSVYDEVMRNPARVYNATFQGKYGYWVSELQTQAAIDAANTVNVLKTPFGEVEASLVFDGKDVKLQIVHNNRLLATVSANENGVLGQMFSDEPHEDRACLWHASYLNPEE